MSDTKPENSYVHPSVLQAIHKQDVLGQIDIETLSVGDLITVETRNSVYHLKLVEVSEKGHRVVLTSTNKKYPGPYTQARLIGTTISHGASTLNPRRFAVGGDMELVFVMGENGNEKVKTMTTSPVKSVSINGTQVLPVPEVHA